jgi:antitoxin (DNA-binding transcriptional repressor) of toxin-antitoxin stability system
MTTISSEHLSDNPGEVRRSLRNGTEVTLTFRGKPFGRVVAPERLDQLEAELERLRNLVSEHGLAEEVAA